MQKSYLFFDCETTGIIKYGIDLLDPSQPRIVQLAALLMDENGNPLEELDVYIKPDGWTIPEEVQAIHGITTEKCEAEGIPMPEVLAKFNDMKARCSLRAAYNISFDKRMLAREAGAYGIEHKSSEHLESVCVMEMARKIINEAPTDKMMASGRKTSKAVKLKVAYQHFFGCEFQNAHNAMADLKATAAIFFKIRGMERKEAA